LKRLVLSNNSFSGTIPSQIGQLQGASVFLKDNRFYNSSATDPAPLSLCLKRKVEEFDLVNDNTLCPIERNVLSEFYDSAKGAEWTDQGNKTNGTEWLHEYASYCGWKGVTCDDKNHVTKLQLSNNGLSGKLSDSIGELKFMEVLDLSDNDMKVI
jgi:Leucine-rich repeat (LRR) protein